MTGRLGDALRLEWVRVSTVRSTYVLAALAVLLGAAVAALIAELGRGSGPDPTLATMVLTSGGDVIPLPFAATFMAVLGVLGVGHDYRYGLSRVVLTVQPARSVLVVARLIVLAVISLAVAGFGMLLDGALGMLLAGPVMALDAEVARSAVGYLLLTVLWSWLGAAGTWLLRATVPVLTALLVLPLVVEPLLKVLAQADELAWLRPLVRWLPFSAGEAMIAVVPGGDGGEGLSRVQGGLEFAALAFVVLVPAWVLFRRRDA
jgi:ABC-2 type transport system permease protein